MGSSWAIDRPARTSYSSGRPARRVPRGTEEAALDFLEKQGYDIGSAGSYGYRSKPATTTRTDFDHVLPVDIHTTEASKLQQRAEQGGIQSLHHNQVARIGNRLLKKNGWDLAWEWFEEQYGPDFDPVETWCQLKSLVDTYQDLLHVIVPPSPDG